MTKPATIAELTPAGKQVESALAQGYEAAAFNLYLFNMREDVAMVVGDRPREVSVWPEWHQMIQARIGEGEVAGEAAAGQEADALGLEGEEREDYIVCRIEELNETAPSIIERTVRNDKGEVVNTELVSNPDLDV